MDWGVEYGQDSPSASELARDEAEIMDEDEAAERELFGDGVSRCPSTPGPPVDSSDGDEDYENVDIVEQGLVHAERDALASQPGISGPSTLQSVASMHPWVHRNAPVTRNDDAGLRGGSGRGSGRGSGAGPSRARRGRRVVDDGDDGDDYDDYHSEDNDLADPTREANPVFTPHHHDAADAPVAAGRTGIPIVDARGMDDFDQRYFGQGIQANPPIFEQGTSSNSTWQNYDDVGNITRNIRPLRTMCWNIPVELFARDGTRFRHWATPNENTLRASQIAAIIGMAFTPTSKGFLSGSHEELQRANGDADEDAEGGEKKKISRVFRYAFMTPHDNNVTAPMFVIGYQELYNTALTEVTAIRIYKFVFDEKHSDSELMRKLMDENRDTFFSAGTAHNQNATRRKNMVSEQKHNRVVTGGLAGRNNLEYYAGTQYSRVINETVLLETLKSYGGKSMYDDGLPVFDYSDLPRGVTTTRMGPATNGLGGTHPLSPEYMYNARRWKAFRAGLINFEGKHIDVHPDFLDPTKHFSDHGDFVLPAVGRKTGGFFFCIDPSVTNIFDVALPRSIYGAVCAGKHLLELFKDENPDMHGVDGGSNATLLDCFNQMMTAKDAEHMAMEKQMAETVFAYDSIDVSDVERKGLRHYGDVDSQTNSYIIEPRQIMKEIQVQTRRVLADLVVPWKLKRDKLAEAKNYEMRTSDGLTSDLMQCDHADARLQELHDLEAATRERHCKVMKDLAHLHIGRIEAAFQSKMDRETIPAGYSAMFDGLKAETDKTVNNTASMAFAFNEYLTADDISIFAHVHQWLGNFFEYDCFIEGRDRRLMDEIFLHLFEQYGDVTFLVLLCGYKGNGKSLRTERVMAVFPPNWVVAGGPSSAKSGMNGQSDSTNGKNVIYDEMVDDLCDADGSDRLEYWKQIVLKREYIYQRTVNVKGIDGTETHKTMKLRTPHDETHLMCVPTSIQHPIPHTDKSRVPRIRSCTNYGMAYTKNGDPSDTKFAMIDRSIAHMVRSIGKSAHTDNEFYEHMSKPAQQSKLSVFRMFVCLVGATKLVTKGVPAFQPNLALANKIFDYLDNQMIVGEYNLPRRTPRKSLKREENLRTMTVMNAVAKVFLFKQTACEFDSGRLGPDGKPQPFKWTMLYDVVRQLVPTPELIFMAWSQSLDYNIGTSAHTFAAMTAVCEVFNIEIGSWMKKPPTEPVDQLRSVTGEFSPSFMHNHPIPVRTDSKYMDLGDKAGDEEFKKDKLQWQYMRDSLDTDSKFDTLPHFMGDNGATKDEVKQLVVAMERQRRATSAYRHRCTIEGNSEIFMNDPSETIEKIMKGVDKPLDAVEASGSTNDGSEYMPLYTSCIMANAVQVSILHNMQAVAQWMSGGHANEQQVGTCGSLGTMSGLNFSKSKRKGACVWNTAWMRSEHEVSGWMGFAREVVNSNYTCKIFDLPMNGLRDLVFLLSTRDNNRRCTEEPRLPYQKQQQMAFVNNAGSSIGDGAGSALGIRMRGIQDSRNAILDAGVEWVPRHSYSEVPDVHLQRSLDVAVNACRFPAMVPIFSNNVMDSPPVRTVQGDGENKKVIELNTAAALEHTKMMAEGILRCSTHPGLQNEHERFCEDAGGPAGLCCPSGFVSDDENIVTKLPYSYDIMTIALTLDAMSRYYDPIGREYAEMFKDEYGDDLGLDVEFEDLPHMSLRFVGLKEEVDRRLLSYKVPEKNNPVFGFMECGEDLDQKKINECHAMVSITLGHYATEDEVSQYLKSRSGSRAMSGVRGDLLSMETWLRHSHTVLQERGMVSGPDDVVMGLIADEPYQLRTRVTEMASAAINKLVDKHPRMADAEEARPNDDKLSAERLEALKEERRHRIRTELYDTMPLDEHLEDLRHCGPLRIMNANIKRTYHNTKPQKSAPESSKDRRQPVSWSAASTYSDTSKTMKQGLPGNKKRKQPDPSVDGVFSRGVRDSRGRK